MKFHISKYFPIIFLLIIFSLSSCGRNKIPDINSKILKELDVNRIELAGKITERKSELSGLTWYGNQLILLPQFPNKFKDRNGGTIYSISKKKLQSVILKNSHEKILPNKIALYADGLEQFNSHGSGYEAITFIGDTAFISIEYMHNGITEGYLVSGIMSKDKKSLTLDKNTLTKIPLKEHLFNSSCETIVNYKNNIYAIFEANGKNVNPHPVAYMFDTKLNFMKFINFPSIEYRITDATEVDTEGNFWAINYFYPGDKKLLKPSVDSLSIKYGKGKTNALSQAVERLVRLKFNRGQIINTNAPPLYLKLDIDKPSRNWEGIAKFDDIGFLIVTDTYPETILAFVKYP